MHILDGMLPTPLWAGGLVTGAALTAATLPALGRASPPRVAMATSAFFVASALAIPVPGTEVHASLLGLAGIVLGRAALPAVLVGLTLQKVLLGAGGWATLGVNLTTMGLGALVAAGVYRAGRRWPVRAAAAAGALGTLVALVLYGAVLLAAGNELERVAWVAIALHAPVVLLEAALTAAAVRFLLRVQPDLVGGAPGLGLADSTARGLAGSTARDGDAEGARDGDAEGARDGDAAGARDGRAGEATS